MPVVTPGSTGLRTRWMRIRRFWWVLAAMLITVGLLLAVSQRGELRRALELLTHVSPAKALVALGCQAACLACLAGLQQWLLAVGGVRVPLAAMGRMVLAANAMAGALPGGAAFGAAWLYREFRRRGADRALTAGVLAASGVLSALALVAVIVLGVLLAGTRGPGMALLWTLAILALLAVAGLIVLRSPAVRKAIIRRWERIAARHENLGSAGRATRDLIAHARTARPGLRPWLTPAGLALLNWLLDAACLLASLWALGLPVPWSGLLLAFALVQIPVSARITPGGLGIAEASLTGLLVVYGLNPGQAFAATLLYRIFSYWLLEPIGWGCWLATVLERKR
ncbi:YbhN family protein [Streptomyces sp. NBC_01808]|uniref:lysylphosphatidylglycerol synthase transmembrane domain-containing protein n=1 Tax=Streptomyces sp. NBC_01808 TaxID=2975947 RepID=UPI002DD8556C|nr:YbhN family protein [Streptomyces sp. NBC_01808]WSA37890.1 YbhN family protein [Streptomyces sp. NBC_01808]